MNCTPLPKDTVFKLEQPSNVSTSISDTLFGIEMEVKATQFEKAPLSISVTLDGILMVVKAAQPEKAFSPILMTLLGISIDVISFELQKAKSLISFTVYVSPSYTILEGMIMWPDKSPLSLPAEAILFVLTIP